MLSLFPQLLWLSPLGLTIIRVACGLTLLYLAYYHSSRVETLGAIRFPVVGRGNWIVWCTVVCETLFGAALAAGFLTQLAALLSALYMLKHLFWQRRFPQFFLLSYTAALLMLAISLCLLVSGPGTLSFSVGNTQLRTAVDIPL